MNNIRKLPFKFKKGAFFSIDNILHRVSIHVIVKTNKAYFFPLKIPIIGIFKGKNHLFKVLILIYFTYFSCILLV